MISSPNFECPPAMENHIREIFGGEYDVPYSRPAPVIIDIGANIGGFALWASRRWQSPIIHCYEPVPANFEILLRNLSGLDQSRIHTNNFAIGDPKWTRMFLGKNNCGEASFFDMGEQLSQTINVETRRADTLPPAHILKIDAEGSEVDILKRAPMGYDVILIEFHGENNRRAVDAILRNYCLVAAHIRHPHRGILKYIDRKILPPQFTKYEASYPVAGHNRR